MLLYYGDIAILHIIQLCFTYSVTGIYARNTFNLFRFLLLLLSLLLLLLLLLLFLLYTLLFRLFHIFFFNISILRLFWVIFFYRVRFDRIIHERIIKSRHIIISLYACERPYFFCLR